jgi:hypothetical protein
MARLTNETDRNRIYPLMPFDWFVDQIRVFALAPDGEDDEQALRVFWIAVDNYFMSSKHFLRNRNDLREPGSFVVLGIA